MRTTSMAVSLLSVIWQLGGCSGGDDSKSGEAVVIGGLFSQSATSSAQVEGVRMAVKDINESKVFDRELKVVALEFNDDSDRQAMVKELYDTHRAVAMVSEWSSTSKHALNVTNNLQDHYTDFVNCSASSTNTTINDPTISDSTAGAGFTFASDKNDTLYRGVSNDKKQARVVWAMISDKTKAGVFYCDDSYGQSFEVELKNKMTAESKAFVFDAAFPADNFSVTGAVKTNIDSILAKNLAGELTTLVVVGLPNHGGPIMKELTEATVPFNGTIIVTDGSIEASFFGPLTDKFTTWMAQIGHTIVGTAPECYSGNNSDAWVARLKLANPGVDVSDAFVPSAADCTYAFALALMYGVADTGLTAKTIKDNLPKLKEAAFQGLAESSIQVVNADPDGLEAAAKAIALGKIVKLDGASGVFVFDANGDRIGQPYKTMKPIQSGNYTWQRVKVYDGDTGNCLLYCN